MFERLSRALVEDSRDVVFVRLVLRLFVLVPLPIAMVYVGTGPWVLGLGLAHLALVVWLLGPFILMRHQLAHRPGTFRRPYRWIVTALDWTFGPLLGLSPFTYVGHHIGMHHPENNMAGDLSSTLPYQRDSLKDFVRYWGAFFLCGVYRLIRYLGARGRRTLLLRTLFGEGAFLLTCALLAWWSPLPTLLVLGVPLVFTRFAMIAGNWAQHAFVDPQRPDDPFANSITCIDTRYNDRCFNDGYHALHHLKPSMHWGELPAAFARFEHTFVERRAVVVRGLDHFQVWTLLMLRKHKKLAAHLVMPKFDTEEAAIAFLAERLRPIAR